MVNSPVRATQLLKNKNKSHLDKKLEVVNNLIFFPFFLFFTSKEMTLMSLCNPMSPMQSCAVLTR